MFKKYNLNKTFKYDLFTKSSQMNTINARFFSQNTNTEEIIIENNDVEV